MSSNATDGNDAFPNNGTYIEGREFDPQSAPLIPNSEPLLVTVANKISSRNRRRLQHDVIRLTSFAWGLLAALCAGGIATFSIYAPFFLRDLHYSQYKVNTVAIVAEVAMYLLVPVFGYLCDRYTPQPISIIAAASFGIGYIGAALVYKSGSTGNDEGGRENHFGFGWMLVAFTFIGIGTCAMYLTAVTTCAKNFGKGKYKGLVLALPISAFGVSGMWQAQLGSHILTRPASGNLEGAKELDPAKYFLFLAVLLTVVGVVGAFAFRIVDEDDLIDEAVEDLERSGLLVASRRPSAYSRSGEMGAARAEAEYGTFGAEVERTTSKHAIQEGEDDQHAEEEREKKTWLLNYETSLFLHDETMWLLAIGFLFVTGPSEAYINNVGTIIDTLTPSDPAIRLSPGLASTHVSIIALSSTIARLL
ncbi:putative monocarboxylate transporter mch1, partial [Ascosphaera aggregata]